MKWNEKYTLQDLYMNLIRIDNFRRPIQRAQPFAHQRNTMYIDCKHFILALWMSVKRPRISTELGRKGPKEKNTKHKHKLKILWEKNVNLQEYSKIFFYDRIIFNI